MPDTQTTTSVAWQLVPTLVSLRNLIDHYYQLLNNPPKSNELKPQDILKEINNQLQNNNHNLPHHINFPSDLEGINQALTQLSQEIVTTQTPTPEYSHTTTPAPEFSTPNAASPVSKLQASLTKTPQEQREIIQELNHALANEVAPSAAETISQIQSTPPEQAAQLRQSLRDTQKPPLHQAIESELQLGGVSHKEASNIARQLSEVVNYEGIVQAEPFSNLPDVATKYQIPLAPAHQAILNQPTLTALANQQAATTSLVSLASPSAVEAVIQNAPLMAQVDQFLTAKGFPSETLAKFPVERVNLALEHLIRPDFSVPPNPTLGPNLHRLFADNPGSLPQLANSLLSSEPLSTALQTGSFPSLSKPKLNFFQRIRFFFSPQNPQILIQYAQTLSVQPPQTSVSFLIRMRTFLSNPLGIFKPLGEAGQGMVTGGSEASSGLLGKLGGFFGKAGTGLLNGLQGLGAKLGLGSVGGAAAGGAASAAGTAATTGVTAAAAATWEIWVPIIIIGIFVFAFFYKGISHTSPMGIARSELVVVGATAGGGVIEENPFVGLTKTANPSSLQDPNGDIVYTYSITPKQGTLTNVTVTQEQITIVQESGNRQSTITPPTPPETFDATFTSHPYTFTLDSSMDDAIIVNTITITATDPNGDPQAVTVSATTLIGNPPTGCFIFQPPPFIDNRITAGVWPATLLSWENAAAAQIIGSFSTAGAPTLCSQGTIDIYYAVAGTDVTCGGWYLQGGNIAIDSRSASCTNANALYTLAHEAGHVYTDRNGDTLVAFRQKGLVTWNGSSCSNTPYPFAAEYISSDASCYSESFAEGFSRCIAGLPIDSGWCDWFAANVFNR